MSFFLNHSELVHSLVLLKHSHVLEYKNVMFVDLVRCPVKSASALFTMAIHAVKCYNILFIFNIYTTQASESKSASINALRIMVANFLFLFKNFFIIMRFTDDPLQIPHAHKQNHSNLAVYTGIVYCYSTSKKCPMM